MHLLIININNKYTRFILPSIFRSLSPSAASTIYYLNSITYYYLHSFPTHTSFVIYRFGISGSLKSVDFRNYSMCLPSQMSYSPSPSTHTLSPHSYSDLTHSPSSPHFYCTSSSLSHQAPTSSYITFSTTVEALPLSIYSFAEFRYVAWQPPQTVLRSPSPFSSNLTPFYLSVSFNSLKVFHSASIFPLIIFIFALHSPFLFIFPFSSSSFQPYFTLISRFELLFVRQKTIIR